MLTNMEYRPGWQRLGLAFNRYFERNMMILMPASIAIGFLGYSFFHQAAAAVPWLFAYITFVMGLDCSVRQITATLKQWKPMFMLLLLAHGIMPWLAYQSGKLLFGADSPYVIGLVLFAVIPLGVSSIIWVGLSRGNVPFVLALIVIDSLLSPLVVPWLIHLYFGQTIAFDTGKVMRDLLFIIVIPTIAGIAVHEVGKGNVKPRYGPVLLPVSRLAFAAVVVINSAVIAPYVHTFKNDLIRIVPAAFLLIAAGYALGFAGSRPFRDEALSRSLSYSAGMRNISLGLVIGVAYFEPAAAVPVVLTILLQQPTATLVHKLWTRFGNFEGGR